MAKADTGVISIVKSGLIFQNSVHTICVHACTRLFSDSLSLVYYAMLLLTELNNEQSFEIYYWSYIYGLQRKATCITHPWISPHGAHAVLTHCCRLQRRVCIVAEAELECPTKGRDKRFDKRLRPKVKLPDFVEGRKTEDTRGFREMWHGRALVPGMEWMAVRQLFLLWGE